MYSGKRLFFLGILLMGTMLILGGCMEGSLHITVNEDKSADVVHEMGFDNFIIEMMEEDMGLEELEEEMSGEGYEVSSYEEQNVSGIRAKRSFDSMEQLNREDFDISLPSENGKEEEMNVGNIAFTEGFFRDQYRADLIFDMREDISEEEFGEMSETLGEQINFDFVLTLPVRVSDHNADQVEDDGHTLRWDLKPGEKNQVTLSGAVWNMVNVVIFAGLVVVVLAGGVMIYKSKVARG
ncbi:MAG: LppM family (lipo)protein [Halanaerobiales bacterium]